MRGLSRLKVAKSGYECVEVDGKSVVRAVRPHHLVDIKEDAEGLHHPLWYGEERAEDALRVVNLHRAFAKLKPTPELIVQFANKHGLLGLPNCDRKRVLDHGSYLFQEMEPLSAWGHHIDRLKAHIRLYDIAPLDEGKNCVQWFDKGYKISYRIGGINYGAETSDPNGTVQKGDTMSAILSDVRHTVNEELKNKVSGFLESDGLVLVSPTLLGAVWLSFASEIAGNYMRRRFKGCGHVRLCEPGVRSDKVYCSARCAKRAYRKRRNEVGTFRD